MKRFLLILSCLPFSVPAFSELAWADNTKSDQVVIVVDYGSPDLTRLHQLEDELDAIAKQTNSGELDGDEVTLDSHQASIYMRSTDTEKLMKAIRPTLRAHDFSRDARIRVGG
ncbi:hypothetical protein [Paraburkholderia bannensis]|uniref:hypothetical protein n=1 Tax=Paraburkholderia bannensis TaxID=765414 RepID=UPI002AB309F8|nr:hypothetical protein [Paraburkholderia bannensis]